MLLMNAAAYVRGKKITVMGLGLLGRGVGDIRYLAQQGAELIVTDLKSKEALAPSLEALASFPNITFVLGEHRIEDFQNRDVILKAPKTPLDSPFIAEAVRQGIPVTMSTALFARLAQDVGATLVGITGTRGKTTTTHMIAQALTAAGKHVVLGGNVQGISTLSLLDTVTKDTYAVLELDSWQLQGFRAEGISPHVAVFTNFYPDHLDYYPDMHTYLADKAEIFLHQSAHDVLVIGEQAQPILEKTYHEHIRSRRVVAAPFSEPLVILGEHNRANAGCAFEAIRAMGIDENVVRQSLARFPGVAGRLELIREREGVKIYNDTTSTTPEATLAALEALSTKERTIVLIMGGYDKGLDMHRLLLEIPKKAKRVILLAGSGTNRVLPFIPEASVYDSLQAAVTESLHAAGLGDTVLFSPAFASFGMFANEYDRGDQFVKIARSI